MTDPLILLSPRANNRSKWLCSQEASIARMGFRFSATEKTVQYGVLDNLRTGDHVLQPILGGVVIFVDPKTAELPYSFTIDVDDQQMWVFTRADRSLQPKPEKTKKSSSKKTTKNSESKPKEKPPLVEKKKASTKKTAPATTKKSKSEKSTSKS